MVSFWDQRRAVPIVAKWNCPNTLCCTVALHLVCNKLLNLSAIQGSGLWSPCWNGGRLIVLIEKGILVAPLLDTFESFKPSGPQKKRRGGMREKRQYGGAFVITTQLRDRFVPVWGHTGLKAPGGKALCPHAHCSAPVPCIQYALINTDSLKHRSIEWQIM